MREQTFLCSRCHREHPVEDRYSFHDLELCGDCWENETAVCDCCGTRYLREGLESDGRIEICESCSDRHYTRCTRCERLIHLDDAYYFDDSDCDAYCYDCYQEERAQRKFIHPYNYKPDPIFYGLGNRYLGVELEIDEGGESEENAAELLRIANEADELVYIKRDGSLAEGFEIVSHPLDLTSHMELMPWAAVMDAAVQMGYRSHQTSTCGLHVHVNRDSLGSTQEDQEAAIGRILFFLENHWYELLRFSRRTQRQMDQWAARYGRKDSPREQMEHVKKGFGDRYRCLNLCNAATIEFRLFRGSLRYNSTFIATLQLVNEICEVACCLSDEEMAQLTWSDFVARIGNLDYPELVQYLKERRLYTNDPVSIGEEDL